MQIASLIATSSLIAEQDDMAMIADNIANASTPAYQAERMQFTDWLAPSPHATPGSDVALGANVAFVVDRGTWRERTSGAFRKTGNPFDIAIGNPDAWFRVQTPSGVRLTRAGAFTLSANRTIVDQDGDPLLDRAGRPITLGMADTGISIAADGTLSSRENGIIAEIGLVRPADPVAMAPEGGRLFNANGPTVPVAAPALMQRMLEDSNVAPILEITRMIDTERRFAFLAQFLQEESDRRQNAMTKITSTSS
jgi:flagellar basal-body rod protein FlgF